jgi:hypothetical protein
MKKTQPEEFDLVILGGGTGLDRRSVDAASAYGVLEAREARGIAMGERRQQ